MYAIISLQIVHFNPYVEVCVGAHPARQLPNSDGGGATSRPSERVLLPQPWRPAEDELERFLVPNHHLQARQWAFQVECGRFYRIRRISGQSRPIRVPRSEGLFVAGMELSVMHPLHGNKCSFYPFPGPCGLGLWIWDHHGSVRMRICILYIYE